MHGDLPGLGREVVGGDPLDERLRPSSPRGRRPSARSRGRPSPNSGGCSAMPFERGRDPEDLALASRRARRSGRGRPAARRCGRRGPSKSISTGLDLVLLLVLPVLVPGLRVVVLLPPFFSSSLALPSFRPSRPAGREAGVVGEAGSPRRGRSSDHVGLRVARLDVVPVARAEDRVGERSLTGSRGSGRRDPRPASSRWSWGRSPGPPSRPSCRRSKTSRSRWRRPWSRPASGRRGSRRTRGSRPAVLRSTFTGAPPARRHHEQSVCVWSAQAIHLPSGDEAGGKCQPLLPAGFTTFGLAAAPGVERADLLLARRVGDVDDPLALGVERRPVLARAAAAGDRQRDALLDRDREDLAAGDDRHAVAVGGEVEPGHEPPGVGVADARRACARSAGRSASFFPCRSSGRTARCRRRA